MANGLTPNIKQIMLADGAHDIEALHFLYQDSEGVNLNSPADWKNYIDTLVGGGLQIVIDQPDSTGQKPATTPSADTMGKLYLVQLSGQVSGTYTEFITLHVGDEYLWEKIGTTDADLTQYAKKTEAGKADTYTSSSEDLTTDAAGAGKIDVEHTFKYDKSAETTGAVENHQHTVTGKVTAAGTIEVGDGVANYTPTGTVSAPAITLTTATQTVATEGIKAVTSTFEGTETTINLSGNVTGASVDAHAAQTLAISGTQAVTDHDHTATQTVTDDNKATVVGSISGFNGGTSTFTQGEDSFTANVPTAIDVTKFSGGELTGTKTFNTDAIKAAEIIEDVDSTFKFNTNAISAVSVAAVTTGAEFNVPSNAIKSADLTGEKSFFNSATVSTDGVLSFATGTVGITYTAADNQGYKLNPTAASTKGIKVNTTAASTGTVGFTAAALADGFYTAGTAATFTQGTDSFNFTGATMTVTNATVIKSLPGITIGANGGFTIAGSNFSAALPTLSHTVNGGAVSLSTTYTPAGSITNSYTNAATTNINLVTAAALANAPVFTGTGVELNFAGSEVDIVNGSAAAAGAHTHTITLTSTDVDGEGTVTIANHTHSIAGHTHTVVIAPIATAAV